MRKQKMNAYSFAANTFICLLQLYLLWFNSGGLTSISSAKQYAFYSICFLFFASMFLILLIEVLKGRRTLSDFRYFLKRISFTQILIGIYLLITLISSFLSPYRQYVLFGASRYEGLLTISCYCVSFFLISQFAQPRKWMLWLLSAVMIIFSTIGILQRLNFNPLFLYPLSDSPYNYSFTFISTIGNIDYVAALLCIAIPILWVSMLRASSKYRFSLLIPTIISLFLLILIDVAAGFVGILFGTLLSLPVVIPSKRRTRRIICCTVISVILIAMILFHFLDFSNNTLHEFHEVLNGRIRNRYGSGRIRIWKRVFEKLPERVWFGYGPDTMSVAGLRKITFVNKNNVVVRVQNVDVAHNEYLNILFHQGIFALLAYLAAIFSALKKWIRSARQNSAAAIFGAAILAYCIQAFFGISQLITAPFFWCAFALFENSLNNKNRPSCT